MPESRFFQNCGTFCFDLYWKYHNFERTSSDLPESGGAPFDTCLIHIRVGGIEFKTNWLSTWGLAVWTRKMSTSPTPQLPIMNSIWEIKKDVQSVRLKRCSRDHFEYLKHNIRRTNSKKISWNWAIFFLIVVFERY